MDLIIIYIVIGLFFLPTLQFVNILSGFIIRSTLKRRLKVLSKGCLILTYDDGPGDKLQSKIIQLLEQYESKATFFVLGIRAEGRMREILEIKRHGHEIGSHSFAHLNAIYTDPISIYRDFKQSKEVFKSLAEKPKLYRPPYGKMTFTSWWQAHQNGYLVAFWTHRGRDDGFILSSTVCEEVERDGGGVVLLHSHNRSEENREKFVLRITEDLLKLARDKGFRICCLSEVMR